MNRFARIMSYVGVALLGAALTIALLPRSVYVSENSASTSKLELLLDQLDTYYIEDIDRTALEDAAADAIMSAIGDRWGYYIPADEYSYYVEQSNNAYVGIGITIRENAEAHGFEIMELTPGGSAEKAGLQVHDVLIRVGEQNCFEIGIDETRNLVRGEEGTMVTLTYLRDGQEHTITLARQRVDVAVATYELLPSGYGLITIENFDSKCAKETIAAIEALMEQNVKGLIFDVRFNPGGYQHELVEVLDYILPEGPLFKSEAYDGQTTVDYSDESHIEIPMAVLVNGDSYSAAEFFAAALQEYDYALVVGQHTTGKGHYQVTFSLNDGSASHFSIGRYYTPNGVSLDGVGITPDVVEEVDEEMYQSIYFGQVDPADDPQIQAAISALELRADP